MTGSTPPRLGTSRLVLWRHGRTAWNAAGRFQGQLDPPLDAEGHREAVTAAAQLVASGMLTPEPVVISSDLGRTVQTAAVLTGLLGVQLRVDARLREHGLGRWEGLTRAEVAQRFPQQYAEWISGRPVTGRGGENPDAVAERALDALVDLPPAPVAVVVTHGGTAGRLLERLLGLGRDHHRLLGGLDNCAWSEVVVQGGRWRLLRHNIRAVAVPDGNADATLPTDADAVL